MPPPEIKDAFRIGSKVVILQDCDLRGEITIHSGTVLHPRCTVLAMSGPIIIGSNNIIEENVIIVNRLSTPMIIGDNNLFQVGARIESPTIGNWNTFGVKCRTVSSVSVGSNCSIGPGCVVLPSPFPPPPPPPPSSSSATEPPPLDSDTPIPEAEPTPPPSSASSLQPELLPSHTQIYGGPSDPHRRLWSGEGSGQARAFHEKQLNYLRETLPKFHKLKLITQATGI